MTHETESAAMADVFRGYRERAVAEFRKYVPDMEDTWEGVMGAADRILRHADEEGEMGGAVMAAAMWTHGYLEEDTACRMKKLEGIVDAEVEASRGRRAPVAAPTPAPSAK